jgi:hypothetical protein
MKATAESVDAIEPKMSLVSAEDELRKYGKLLKLYISRVIYACMSSSAFITYLSATDCCRLLLTPTHSSEMLAMHFCLSCIFICHWFIMHVCVFVIIAIQHAAMNLLLPVWHYLIAVVPSTTPRSLEASRKLLQ